MSELAFDYIVVGAGTAGCLLANRLSADPSRSVLLLEAGGRDSYPWIHIPVGYLYCIDNPRTDWCLRTEPDPGLNGRKLLYPRGRTLGGCSSINGMLYLRGQARDYDQWARLTGANEWSWEACLPDFKAHEDYHQLDIDARPRLNGTATEIQRHHGHGGEWRIEAQRLRWEILDEFANAAVQAGIPKTDDFNRGDNTGVAYFEVNQRKGWRWSTASGFLKPIERRKNLTVWTNAQVKGVTLGRDSLGALVCKGVEFESRAAPVKAVARREVVLAAGAIGSPQLLQLSGIGPGMLLQKHGIATVQDLPGVGANLQDHLQLRTVYRINGAKTLNTLASSLWGKATIGLEYALTRTGPMSMAPSQLGIFTRSDPSQTHANIEFHVQPLSLEAFGQPLHSFSAVTASVCGLNPTSRGTVTIASPRSQDAPSIMTNYLSTEEDRKVAADAIRVARRIASQPALTRFAPEEVKPGKAFDTDEALAKIAGDIGTTIFHPVGTAKMGRSDDPLAVVDSHLRVRGVKGLRVVDASVMPTIISGNTNSPTLMIAEKAARWIAAGT
ncbi:GMC family oxidoreductase N-terminal domain-containing protein [Hyphomicrobium sp.]|uniref:GMC family oxidoreductase n=1 Tax=Hyphomicrobium sp. TaxID=82 RepID=UPI001D1D8DED|nr:GMC family oxidoreductase N-terminal domain-containing protein [Hyphomicrobium sp.]MBY0558784.1 GMC family oxidoreductase N-terminal domain-containing protein [Hyphomicrobium sp.]